MINLETLTEWKNDAEYEPSPEIERIIVELAKQLIHLKNVADQAGLETKPLMSFLADKHLYTFITDTGKLSLGYGIDNAEDYYSLSIQFRIPMIQEDFGVKEMVIHWSCLYHQADGDEPSILLTKDYQQRAELRNLHKFKKLSAGGDPFVISVSNEYVGPGLIRSNIPVKDIPAEMIDEIYQKALEQSNESMLAFIDFIKLLGEGNIDVILEMLRGIRDMDEDVTNIYASSYLKFFQQSYHITNTELLNYLLDVVSNAEPISASDTDLGPYPSPLMPIRILEAELAPDQRTVITLLLGKLWEYGATMESVEITSTFLSLQLPKREITSADLERIESSFEEYLLRENYDQNLFWMFQEALPWVTDKLESICMLRDTKSMFRKIKHLERIDKNLQTIYIQISEAIKSGDLELLQILRTEAAPYLDIAEFYNSEYEGYLRNSDAYKYIEYIAYKTELVREKLDQD